MKKTVFLAIAVLAIAVQIPLEAANAYETAKRNAICLFNPKKVNVAKKR
jgi:hypothetical protein